MKRISVVILCIIVLAALVAWTPDSEAYNRYNDGCQNCHGAFTDGESPLGTTFPGDDKHQMHRSSGNMNTECDLCHTSGDGRNPYIGSSDGTASNLGLGCTGCHEALGLRAHHGSFCASCHQNDPAPPTEDVIPPYYGTVDTNADFPCNSDENTSEDWTGDGIGLDNDGDGLYDMDDPDCEALPEADCFDGIDNDEDGAIDCADTDCAEAPDGPPCDTGDQGICAVGTLTCSSGSETCVTSIQPEPENCTDGLDNDCDGFADIDDIDCGGLGGCIDDIDCDDGNACNGAETCDTSVGVCVSGTILECDDGNVCNGTESCHPILGCQEGTPLTCDNGLFCDGTETCDPVNGCQSSAAPCDPGTQSCNEDTNICEEIVTGCTGDSDCNNGNACDGTETCNITNGECIPGPPPDCDDGNVCNGTETCDPANGCQAGTPLVCDDSQFCTGIETCDPVAGCVDGQNPCPTGDTCDETSDQCLTPECEVDADCDDALFCTGIETCVAGFCQPGTDPCAAGETCEETSDQCLAPSVLLDISGFRVTKRVSLRRVKPVKIKLVVKNRSQFISSARDATVVGMQNGVEVYVETMAVEAISSGGRLTVQFPPYIPAATGDIVWTATVLDDTLYPNASATATTKVVP